MIAGLATAGITGAVLFTAKPVEVVSQYNRDYGF
jgi:hypothetical protein